MMPTTHRPTEPTTDPTTDALTDTFSALANPTRRAILARLSDGEATVNELARPFEMTLPAVSKHIAVLERAGLIERRRSGTTRPCVLARDRLRQAVEWAAALEIEWTARLDRLGDHLDARTASTSEVAATPVSDRSATPATPTTPARPTSPDERNPG